AEDAVTHGGRDVAVADAVYGNVGRAGVDRSDRKAAAQARGHDVGVVGETDERRAIGDIDVELGIGAKLFAIGRRQAGTNADLVALAVPAPRDAKLALRGLDSGLRRLLHHDVARKVGISRRQRIGKDDADARIGRFGIHLVGGDAEAMLGHYLVEAALETS